MKTYELDTPSLLIDKAIMLRNLQRMSSLCEKAGIRLRPHIKTHKIPEIAAMQVQLSNNGIAVSKIGEAEVMMEAGISDILIANQIIGRQKMERLKILANKGDITVCVDSLEGIWQLSNGVTDNCDSLKVMIEVDTGMNRCGVKTTDIDVFSYLISGIQQTPKLLFQGFLSHSGNIYGAAGKDEIKKIAIDEAMQMRSIARYFQTKGIKVNTVSIGSTPAAICLDEIEGVTEFRPGNYVFNDYIQVCLGIAGIEDCALTVLATIISKPAQNRVVIDAGSKCLGLDKGAHSKQITPGYGYIKEHPDDIIERLSEEHGILQVGNSDNYKIGEKVMIIPNHACAVTNLFNEAFVSYEQEVVDSWKIAARGKVR